MDDGENWEGNTVTNRGFVTRHEKLHYGCGLSRRIEHPDLPGIVYAGQYNDANQRAFYQRWADLMNADSWADVPQRYTPRYAGRPTR
jgi:ethylbenzene dioxygenase alpha subunit